MRERTDASSPWAAGLVLRGETQLPAVESPAARACRASESPPRRKRSRARRVRTAPGRAQRRSGGGVGKLAAGTGSVVHRNAGGAVDKVGLVSSKRRFM